MNIDEKVRLLKPYIEKIKKDIYSCVIYLFHIFINSYFKSALFALSNINQNIEILVLKDSQ